MKINKIEIKNLLAFYNKKWVILLFLFGLFTSPLIAANRVVGANQVLEITPSARQAGLANIATSNSDDVSVLSQNASALTKLNSSWFHFTHTAYYLGDFYDYLAWAMPFDQKTFFGASISRFASDDIPWIKEGEALPEGTDYNTLNIVDMALSMAIARKWRDLSLGATIHVLYRKLDQSGFGFRGDVNLNYQLNSWNFTLLLPALTSSYTKWESGYSEYSKADALLGIEYGKNVPYFYGKLNFNWQSSPVLYGRAFDWKDGELIIDTITNGYNDQYIGESLFDSPLDWFLSSAFAIEYLGEWGGSVRIGLANISNLKTWTGGLGFSPFSFVEVDYAFQSHSELPGVHRLSLNFSFEKFINRDKSFNKKDLDKINIKEKSHNQRKNETEEIKNNRLDKENINDTEENISTGTFLGVESLE